LFALLAVAAVIWVARSGGADLNAEAHRQAWNRHEPTSYQFVYSTGGQCGETRVRIDVKNGQPVALETLEKGCVTMDLETAPTIDGVFDRLVGVYRSGADGVEVTYDSRYGFPANVRVDQTSRTADDEYGFGVEEFVPH
jgi:hypothetical protein